MHKIFHKQKFVSYSGGFCIKQVFIDIFKFGGKNGYVDLYRQRNKIESASNPWTAATETESVTSS